jgi:AcrR family transcriptional regulator
MPANTPQPQRADARHNRERILEAAHHALQESPDASLNSIAKRAGVGPGTLYRHFPTREDLILAVYHHDVEQLVAAVPDLLAQHQPLDALRIWFERLADYIRVKHGLGEALNTAAAQQIINDTYAPVTAAVAELLSACESTGAVRPGLDPADVLLLMGFLWRVSDDKQGREQADRTLDLVLQGLRANTNPRLNPLNQSRGTARRSPNRPAPRSG